MLHKYTDNIAYLFKRSTVNNDLTYSAEGQIFQFNKIKKSRRSLDALTNTYITSTDEVWRTDWQLDFKMHDKVAMTNTPTEDDFSMIVLADDKPILTEGNKHRTKEYYDYDLTVT